MEIHKRYKKNIAVGETTKCGLFVGYLPDKNTTFKWGKVTCDNCLRTKHKTLKLHIIGIKRGFFGNPHIFLNRKTSLNSDIIRNPATQDLNPTNLRG